MYISTDAIILKNIPYKESSVISRVFTYEHGKISVIFKGAKKGKIEIEYYNNEDLERLLELMGIDDVD